MEKKVSLYIEKLDFGYIVTSQGKKKAVENTENVMEHLVYMFKEQIKTLAYSSINDMNVAIIVDTNIPKQV